MSENDNLRRKHILTLEALQALSTENEKLKKRLNRRSSYSNNNNNNNDNDSEDSDNDDDKPSRATITSFQNEIKRMEQTLSSQASEITTLQTQLTSERNTRVESDREGKMFKGKYNDERVLVGKIEREMKAQSVMMNELRKGIDERDGSDKIVSKKREELTIHIEGLESEINEVKKLLSLSKLQTLSDEQTIATLTAEADKIASKFEAQLNVYNELQGKFELLNDELSSMIIKQRTSTQNNTRITSENSALNDENKRSSIENNTLTFNASKLNREVGVLNGVIADLEEKLNVSDLKAQERDRDRERDRERERERERERGNVVVRIHHPPQPHSHPPSPRAPLAAAAVEVEVQDFAKFVHIKKENTALKMQLKALQQTLQMHASKRVRGGVAVQFGR